MIFAFCIFRYFLALNKGPEIYYNAYHTLLSRFDQFIIGMISGRIFIQYNISRRTGLCLLLFGIVGLLADVTNYHINMYRVAAGFTAGGIIWAFVIVGYAALLPGDGSIVKKIALLGNLTYSIYLLHLFISSILLKYALGTGYDTGYYYLNILLYAYIPTLIISIITYMGIERPFLRLKVNYKKLGEQKQSQ